MHSTVKFPIFRRYEQSRVEMNDSIMTIIVGLGVASTALSPEKNSDRIADIFDGVAHVERMNVDLKSFGLKIIDTESHLATMALPYILSLHEDYILTCLELLRLSRIVSRTQINSTNASSMHELFVSSSGGSVPQQLIDEFHILRLIRNSFIHTGGIPNNELLTQHTSLGPASKTKWKKLSEIRTKQLIRSGHKTELCYDEIKIALAVTTEISRYINYILQSKLDRSQWLNILKDDFVSSHSTKMHQKTLKRKLTTYASTFYSVLSLTDREIEMIIVDIEQ